MSRLESTARAKAAQSLGGVRFREVQVLPPGAFPVKTMCLRFVREQTPCLPEQVCSSGHKSPKSPHNEGRLLPPRCAELTKIKPDKGALGQ